ncbi:ATP synthase F1 subunit delta [Candidatus Lariskella endosymbiont of Hedychridium roseum]|uniref:ATP synthase F1 subunit delta n=1 Tax=Candidatus Lariskella endosymbiont of Hedychridium roseum TaxID=3077949 RepID=UPI0030CD88EC
MQDIIIAKRYAKALLEAASCDGLLERIAVDFKSLMAIIDKDAKSGSLMTNSIVPKTLKLSLFETAIKNIDLHNFIKNFVYLLVYHNRVALIKSIFEQFQHLLDLQNNIKTVVVKTASELSKKMINSLKKGLEDCLMSSVRIQNIVDPSIIGGMVVEVDSKLLDASIAGKLNRIKKAAEM